MRRFIVALACASFALACAPAVSARAQALRLEAKIPLGSVKGRIDHLAVDVQHRRLFVAELGNDTVGVVDLAAGKTIPTLGGQHEPQGVAYLPARDTLFVASGGDGMLRLYGGADLAAKGAIPIGDDADNVRIDPATGHVLVGWGSGAIAMVDPAVDRVIGQIELKAHPESFRLDETSQRAFVNIPNAHAIAVINLASKTQTAAWTPGLAAANFPMAVAPDGRVLIVTRLPAKLVAFDPKTGAVVADAPTCGDSDDLFFDAGRGRAYVSCGDGHVDVFTVKDSSFDRIDHVATVQGARTSLFVPELDRLYVAVRANRTEPAAIWVYRPE